MENHTINHLHYNLNGTGTPLLFIAGLGADSQTWSPMIRKLSQSHQCISFDNRGIGKSDYPNDGECTVSKMADDVKLLLDGLQIKKAHLCGHSLGGYIAQVFAARYPQHVNKLVLLSTKTKAQPVQSLYQRTTIEMMKQNVPREIIIKHALSWLFSNDYLRSPQRVENLIKLNMSKPQAANRKSYLYQVAATFNLDTTDEAKKIVAPTFIISGEQDMLATPQDSATLNRLIPQSGMTIIKDMGHMFHIEAPEKLASMLIDFLAA